MAKAAAVTALLNRELNSLSGNSVQASRSSQVFTRDVQTMSREAKGAERSINQLTGRLRLFADAAAIFGPGTVPVGGVLAAGVAGFASQLGFAAVAGGVLAGSMQGLGDALGAMNKAQLEPTNKNLQAAEEALKRLSPATRDFAEQLFDLKPALAAIRDMGAESLMPGLSDAIDSLERLGPRVAQIFQTVAGAMGEIAADGAASLASDRWADFFEMIERDAPQALSEMASAIGDITHGMSEMWEAFAPLNSDFSGWLAGVADGFDRWATGLSATEGFADFVDYIRTTGPQVAETAGALANAIVQIVQASAPLGGPVLAGVEAFADAVSAIADSDLGTPIMAGVAALALLNRSLAVTAALSKTSMSGGLFAGLGTAADGAKKGAGSVRALGGDLAVLGRNYATAGKASERMAAQNAKALANLKETGGTAGKAAGALGGLALVSSGAADGLGLTNTMSLALMGSLAGPVGIAIGAGAGALLDFAAAGDGATVAIDGLSAAVQSGDMLTLSTQIAAAKTELAGLEDIGFNFRELSFSFRDAFGGDGLKEKADEIEAAERALQDLARAESAAEGEAKRAALTYARQVAGNMDLSKWAGRSSEEIKAQADAFAEVARAGQKTAQSFLGLRESLSDSKVSLGGWLADLEKSARALRNFNDNSIKAARRGLDEGLILSLREAGEEGALRMQQLANGTESAIARANKAHQSQTRELERTERVTQRLAGLEPVVKVKADTASAMSSINAVESMLNMIPDEDVFINVRRRMNSADTQMGPRASADGGTVPKTGMPYADRHLYLLADGEEVISNRHGQADRHRSLLKAINGGLAEGGTAGRRRKPPKRGVKFDSLVENDINAQAEAQAAEAQERYYAERERAEREAAERAEHQANMFLAAIEGQERAAQGLIDAAETQKQSAEQVRDGWAQAVERAGSAATSGFQSSLFGSQQRGMWSGPGGSSGSSWRDALSGDIKGLQERGNLVQLLAAQGVTGSALEALLAQGNNAQVSELINSGQAGEFAAMFAQREALTASVGGQVGQAAYGREFAAASAAVAALGSQILALQAELAAITAQRPITVYEAYSAQATAAEMARLQAIYGAA